MEWEFVFSTVQKVQQFLIRLQCLSILSNSTENSVSNKLNDMDPQSKKISSSLVKKNLKIQYEPISHNTGAFFFF